MLARLAGGPLFTEAGERLLGYAQRMMDLHDEALAALGKKPLSGTIRLGMTEDTTGGDVARILGRFTRLHPETRVRTRISQSLTLTDWLEGGRSTSRSCRFSAGMCALTIWSCIRTGCTGSNRMICR
jgi:DNA-binding transcriptional LysR family regulator